MQNKNVIYIFLIFIFLYGCQEVFDAEVNDPDEEILIVEGYMLNGPGPHTVTLSRALPFSSENTADAICCQEVVISDDVGNEVILENTIYGTYKTQRNQLVGVPGRKYKLTINFDDGRIYESDMETMPEPIENVSFTSEYGIETTNKKNSYGELVTNEYTGAYLKANLNNSSSKAFLRVAINFSNQTLYYYNSFVIPETRFCVKRDRISDYPKVAKSSIDNDGNHVIQDMDLGFLPYKKDFYNSYVDTLEGPYPYGWVVLYTVFNTCESAYKFNNDIVNQIRAEDYFFDPLPSAIKGNIKCISNPDLNVTGTFEVSASSKYYWAYRLRGESIYEKEFDYLEFPSKDSCVNSKSDPPSYWVSL